MGKHGADKESVRLEKKWLKERQREIKKNIKQMLKDCKLYGFIPWAPVKIEYRDMENSNNWGWAELKLDKKGNLYFLIVLDIDFLDGSIHGEQRAYNLFAHELAHVLTWHPNRKTDKGLTRHHGVHGPDWMYMYGTLLNLLIFA